MWFSVWLPPSESFLDDRKRETRVDEYRYPKGTAKRKYDDPLDWFIILTSKTIWKNKEKLQGGGES